MDKLYIMNGPDKGRCFDLKGDTIYIGRSPDNNIQVKGRTVSRRHLKIHRKTNEDEADLVDIAGFKMRHRRS